MTTPEQPAEDDQPNDEQQPRATRRVTVRGSSGEGPGGFSGYGYRLIEVDEDVAGQWDSREWRDSAL